MTLTIHQWTIDKYHQPIESGIFVDGQLIITTPYHGYWKNLALAIFNGMDRHYTAMWDGGHIKFFSVKTLTQLLCEEGFTGITFRFAGRLPYLWKGMLASAYAI